MNQPKKAQLSLIRCIRDQCLPPTLIPDGNITAPTIGSRDAMLLWSADDLPRTILIFRKWRDSEAYRAAINLGRFLISRYGVEVYLYQDPADIGDNEESVSSDSDDEYKSKPVTQKKRTESRQIHNQSNESISNVTRLSSTSENISQTLEESGSLPISSIDLVIVVGGDGTVLHMSSFFPGAHPPVLTVAFGSFGFLTVHSEDSAKRTLSRIFGEEEVVPETARTTDHSNSSNNFKLLENWKGGGSRLFPSGQFPNSPTVAGSSVANSVGGSPNLGPRALSVLNGHLQGKLNKSEQFATCIAEQNALADIDDPDCILPSAEAPLGVPGLSLPLLSSDFKLKGSQPEMSPAEFCGGVDTPSQSEVDRQSPSSPTSVSLVSSLSPSLASSPSAANVASIIPSTSRLLKQISYGNLYQSSVSLKIDASSDGGHSGAQSDRSRVTLPVHVSMRMRLQVDVYRLVKKKGQANSKEKAPGTGNGSGNNTDKSSEGSSVKAKEQKEDVSVGVSPGELDTPTSPAGAHAKYQSENLHTTVPCDAETPISFEQVPDCGSTMTPFSADSTNNLVGLTESTVLAPPLEQEGPEQPEFTLFASECVLNELLLERGTSPYMATLNVFVDGVPLTTVAADGLLVATQSGSTAYALSAGGSIIQPNAPAIVFVPICPHTLSFRPLIFSDSVELIIEVPPDARSAPRASFDGRNALQLKRGDRVVISSSMFPLPLLCRKGATEDWVRAIKSKLFWNVRSTGQKPFAKNGYGKT